jgi:hypothetical protein
VFAVMPGRLLKQAANFIGYRDTRCHGEMANWYRSGYRQHREKSENVKMT